MSGLTDIRPCLRDKTPESYTNCLRVAVRRAGVNVGPRIGCSHSLGRTGQTWRFAPLNHQRSALASVALNEEEHTQPNQGIQLKLRLVAVTLKTRQ